MNDKQLTASELQSKYGHSHPKYVVFTWRSVVHECGTRLGYWDWVVEEIAREPTKYTFTVEIETTVDMNVELAEEALRNAIARDTIFTGITRVTSK